jgi:hypothetical protein
MRPARAERIARRSDNLTRLEGMTMTTQHTPGPWTLGHTEANVIANKTLIAEAVRRVDARLIAAAPDLLAVAKACANHFAGTAAPLGQQARRAVLKAVEGT